MVSVPWTFASVLGHVNPETFRRDFWNRKVLHVPRTRPGHYDTLVTLADLERHLSAPQAFARHCVTTPRQGHGMPDPPPASLGEVYGRLLEGNSLRVRKLETLLDPGAPLMALVRDMVDELQHPLESLSCYVAREAAAGLGPHHDETEIFTLQISGRKRWRLFHRCPSGEACTYDPASLAEPSEELTLQAGDFLYIPSGTVHEVMAEAAAFSITLVFDAFRWRCLADLLGARLATLEPFLDALPAGALLGAKPGAALREGLARRLALMKQAVETISVDEVVDLLVPRLVSHIPWPVDGHLAQVLRLPELTSDTIVERVPGLPCHMVRAAGQLRLMLPGGFTLQASVRVEPALRAVLAAKAPFAVGALHDTLSTAAQLVLARRLIGCGVLRPVGVDQVKP